MARLMAAGPMTTLPNTIEPRGSSATCAPVDDGDIVISRATLITTLALLAGVTLLSLLAASFLLHREVSRRRQQRAAKDWGRRSRFVHRISTMRKEVDDSYSRRYQGVLVHEHVENPEMGSESPVEMGWPEQKVWEAPAVPAKTYASEMSAGKWRRGKVGSLWFDARVGLWMPKR